MKKVLLISTLVIWLISTQQIVDFTYSAYLQESSHESTDPREISIHPKSDAIQNYHFPQACYIGRKLNQKSVDSISQLDHKDLDTYLGNLKSEFTELLKISQKIKNTKKNVGWQLVQSSQKSVTVTHDDLATLQKYEKRLWEISGEIDNHTLTLDEYMRSLDSSQNNPFLEATINFQIEALTIKLKYLNKLLTDTSARKPHQSSDFGEYFDRLKHKFDQESNLIDTINNLLKDYNEISRLKSKINGLKGQIEAHDLLIEDREECQQEKKQIKLKNQNNPQIKQLMTQLRNKKKQQSNSSVYCRGVAEKLQEQVKKVLKIYNYTFSCADGLDDLKEKRNKDYTELRQAEIRLKNLQKSKGLDDFKQKFEDNRKFMENSIQQINDFQLQEYSHNPQEIKKIIEKTQTSLDDLRKKKDNLPKNQGKRAFDYQYIHSMVSKIKKLKGNYCRDYDMYDSKAKQLWKNVYKFQEQTSYSSKIHKLYIDEINKLRQLEKDFERLRGNILDRMK